LKQQVRRGPFDDPIAIYRCTNKLKLKIEAQAERERELMYLYSLTFCTQSNLMLSGGVAVVRFEVSQHMATSIMYKREGNPGHWTKSGFHEEALQTRLPLSKSW